MQKANVPMWGCACVCTSIFRKNDEIDDGGTAKSNACLLAYLFLIALERISFTLLLIADIMRCVWVLNIHYVCSMMSVSIVWSLSCLLALILHPFSYPIVLYLFLFTDFNSYVCVCMCTRWVNKAWSPSTSSIQRRLYIFSKFPFFLSFHFHSLLIPPISNLPYLIGHPSICSVCHHVDIRYSATQCTIVYNIVCERR